MSDLEIKETDKMETIRNDNGDLKTSATEDVKISVIVDEDSKSKAKTEEIITEDDKHIKNDVDPFIGAEHDMVVAVEQAKNGKINDNGDDMVAVKIVDDNSSKTKTEEIFTADDKHIQNDIQQFLVAAHDVGVIVEQVKNGKINDIDGGMVSIKNEDGSSRARTEEVITEDDKHVKNDVDELIGAEHDMRVAMEETKNEKINDIGGNIVAVKNDDKDSDTGEMIDDEHIKNDVDRLCDIGVVKESRNGKDQHTTNDIESDIVAVKNLDESVEDILKQSVLDEEPVTDSDDYQDVASESFSQTIEVNPEDLPFFGRSDDLTDLNDEQNLDVTIEIQNENAHKNMTAAGGGSAGTTDQLTSINLAETTKPVVTTDNLTETTASTNISATPKVKKGVGVKKVKMKKHDDTTDETCDKVRLKKVKSRAVNDKRVVTTSAVVAADDNEENEDDDDMWTDNDESSLPWHLDVEESDSGGLITKKKVKAKPKANKKVTIGPNDEIIDLGSWKGADRMTAAALLAAATSTKKKPKSAKAESSTTKTATKKKPTTATTKKPKPEAETGGVEVKKKVKPDDDAKIVNKIKADDGKSAEKPEGISYKKRAIDRDNRESADESTDNTTDDDDDDDEEEEDQVSFANFNIRTSTLRGGDSGRLVTPATDLLKTKLSIMNNASAVVPLREPKPRDRLQTAEIYMTRTSSSFVDDMNKRTVDSAVNRKSTGKLDDKVPMMFDKDGKPIIEIPLPVDEDRKNPQFIPKRGGFYEHDLRNEEEDEDQSTAAAAIPEEEEEEEEEEELKTDKQLKSSKSLAKPRTADRWTHDLYDENDQAPKTSEDIITEYGYDIRKEDSAPKTRRRKKYSGNVTKYNRKSDDADAYIKKPTKKRETQGFYVRGQGLGDRKRQPTIEEPSSSIGVTTAESALSSQPLSSSPPSSATVEKSSHPIGASRPVYDTGGSSSSRRFSDPKESYHRRNMRYDDGPPHNTTTSERPVYNTNRTMHDRRSQQMPVGGPPPPPPTSYANWKQPQDTDYARKRFSDGDRQQQQQQHQFAPWRDKGGYNRNNDNNRHDDKQRAPMYHRGSGVDERGGGGGNNLLQQRMDKFRGRGEMPYGRRGKPDDTGTTTTSAVAEKNSSGSSSAVVDSTPVSPYASTTAYYASASSSASAYPSAASSSFQRQLSMIKQQQSTTNNTNSAAAEKVTQRIAHDVTFNISFTGLPNTDIDTPIIRRREPADEQQSSAVKTTATATDYKQTIQQLENSFQHTRFDGGGDSELLPELPPPPPPPQQTDDAKSIAVGGVVAAVVVDKEDEEVAQLTAAQQYQSSSNNNNNAELSTSMTLPIFQQSVATSSNIVRFTKPPFKTSATTATASSSSSSLAAAAASSDRKLTYNRYEKQSKPYHHPIGTANNNTTYSVIQPSEYRTPIFQRDNDDSSRSTTVQTSEQQHSKSAEFKSRSSYKYEPRKSENPAEERRTTADTAEQAKTEEKTVVPQPPRKLHIRFSARRGRRDTKTSETAETVSKMQQSLETKEIENTFENPTVVHATPIETPPVVQPPPLAEPIQHVPYYHHQGYPDETSAAASGMYMPDPNIAPYVTYLPPGPPLIPPTANQTPAISYHHPGILNYPPSPGTYNPDQFMPPVTFVDTTHGPEPQVVADMYQSHDGVTYYNVHHSPQNSHGQNAAGATRRMNAIPIIPPSVSSPLPPRPSAPEPK